MRFILLTKYSLIASVLTHLSCRTLSSFPVNTFCTKSNPFFISSKHSRRFILEGDNFCPVKPESLSTMAPTHSSIIGNIPLEIENMIQKNNVMIFSKSWCPFCKKAKDLFDSINVPWTSVELDLREDGAQWQESLLAKTGKKTVPQVFVKSEFIGGCDDLLKSAAEGKLSLILSPRVNEYDLVVIGGGSGGLSCVKEAARLGRKAALVNYVDPSPKGTTWGIGGTCVNVGCIPKKLFHTAALIGHSIKDSSAFGWTAPDHNPLEPHKNVNFNWSTLVGNIQKHIKSLNFGYKVTLRKKKIDNINAYASFKDSHKIKLVDDKKELRYITADTILIATGTRPNYPKIPGALEYGITSDDLFSMPFPPGKTLVVGASYVALECASFLNSLGFDTTIMVRSILLRGFDQECANRVGKIMADEGVKFIRHCVPASIKQIKPGQPGQLIVTGKFDDGKTFEDQFNTVVFAIGRSTRFDKMKLNKAGVKLSKTGKIVIKNEQTNVPNIYAVGDCTDVALELAPLAIEAGFLLARRLYAGSTLQTDYNHIPTTVFTSVEYSSCGLTEEEALEKYGEKGVEVFIQNSTPLEWTLPHRPENQCFAKLICATKENMKVLGIHYVGPNAGEVMQLAPLCLKRNCTKDEFDAMIGIHPTCAEVFTTMTITKRSGGSADAQGC